MVRTSKASLFMADPPFPAIERQNLSGWHKRAIKLVTSGKQQLLYIYGKDGTGNMEVALHKDTSNQHFRYRIQAGAGTGKQRRISMDRPCMLSLDGLTTKTVSQAVVTANESTKLARLQVFYDKTEVFVIDEVNAMSASELGLLDKTMC